MFLCYWNERESWLVTDVHCCVIIRKSLYSTRIFNILLVFKQILAWILSRKVAYTRYGIPYFVPSPAKETCLSQALLLHNVFRQFSGSLQIDSRILENLKRTKDKTPVSNIFSVFMFCLMALSIAQITPNRIIWSKINNAVECSWRKSSSSNMECNPGS
jgi:hypothetical protein